MRTENVTILGSAGECGLTDYWGNAIYINGVSGVNVDNVLVFGTSSNNPSNICATTSGQLGNGVYINGTTTSGCSNGIGCGVIFNISRSNFYNTQVGVYYGPYIQGVPIDQCNFTNGKHGIVSGASESGLLDQLSITNS